MLRTANLSSAAAVSRPLRARWQHARSMGISKDASFDTVCLHGGWDGDKTSTSAAVPVHRTSPYIFKDTETAANLFSLKEMGMIYSRLGNPTTDVLERRFALLSGAHENGALAVSSGTSASFYAIINMCSAGDNIVSSSALYGGTFTMFNEILPQAARWPPPRAFAFELPTSPGADPCANTRARARALLYGHTR